ncbi:MAG: hypothetical protein R3B59_00995 [Dehalococcoidia bacterium]
MLVIGQSIECWRPPLADAVAGRDAAPLVARGRKQADAGAAALDVNFGAIGRPGLVGDLVWAASVLRAELPEVTLFLDCGDHDALVEAAPSVPGPIVVNAISVPAADPALIEASATAGAGVVFSPRRADRSDDDGAILDAAQTAADMMAGSDVTGPAYLDCLTYPPATNLERCRRSLRWVAALRESGPARIEPLVAVGNLGHGATRERRRPLRMVYVALAAAAGAGAMILPVEDAELMSLVRALDGLHDPRSDFEAWALALRTPDRPAKPPAGDDLRSAWELLNGPEPTARVASRSARERE